MKQAALAVAFCLSLVPSLAPAQAEKAVEIGEREYMASCAGCHGVSGKGDGDFAEYTRIETPDLTTIRQRLGMGPEEFPYRNTLLLIDGRHGLRTEGSNMPVWGDRYSLRVPHHWWIADPDANEIAALGRMLALVYYLESIQQ